MSLLLGIDLETTGLAPASDLIVEIGAAFFDTDRETAIEAGGFLVRLPEGVALDPRITKLTGITPADLDEWGGDLPDTLLRIGTMCQKHGVSYLVGHNGRAFDRAFLRAAVARLSASRPEIDHLLALPWLDTQEDLPFPEEMKTRKLSHLAAEHGFLNPFPHRALFDVMTSLRLLSCYPLEEVIRRAEADVVTVIALVPFDRRQEAKDAGFFWDAPAKQWTKRVKAFEVGDLDFLPFKTREVGRERP